MFVMICLLFLISFTIDMNIIEIFSKNDERVRFYSNINFTPRLHTDNNVFLAEGFKIVRKLLKSELTTVSILASADMLERLAEFLNDDLTIYLAPKDLINEIVGFTLHEPILAIGVIPDFSPIETLGNKIVVLNGVINSENVGSIVRNALAFSFDSLIFDTKTSSPYLRRAVRVSMGCVFYIKLHRSKQLENDILYLKQNGWRIISAEITDSAEPLDLVDTEGKICYIFGTESKGIDSSLLSISDHIAYVPINRTADSLNVAATSAIFFSRNAF